MGCCVSTTKSDPDLKKESPHQQSPTKSPVEKPGLTHVRDRRDPPPVEEEFVKEVLSETPIVPKPENSVPEEETKIQVPVERKVLNLIHAEEREGSEASQISESYSYSTATTTTTTITENREEDEAMSKRSRDAGHNAINRAEVRRPRKRPHTGELAARRNIPATGPSEVRTRKPNMGTIGARRVSGEGSGRRSRSPATRVAGGVGRSPRKVMGTAGNRSLDSGVQSKRHAVVEEEPNKDVLQQENESLENPLVSLECFIFL